MSDTGAFCRTCFDDQFVCGPCLRTQLREAVRGLRSPITPSPGQAWYARNRALDDVLALLNEPTPEPQ